MGRKWEKQQEGFNEKTINFREVLLKSAAVGISSSGGETRRVNNELLICKLLSNSYMTFFEIFAPPSTTTSHPPALTR